MSPFKSISLDNPPIKGRTQTWIAVATVIAGCVWAWADHNYRISHAQETADKAMALAAESSRISDKLAAIQSDLNYLKGSFDQYVLMHKDKEK